MHFELLEGPTAKKKNERMLQKETFQFLEIASLHLTYEDASLQARHWPGQAFEV